jgi:hypothetical protein
VRRAARLVVALSAGGVLAGGVGACGSDGTGTTAEQVRTAVASATPMTAKTATATPTETAET